MDLDLDLERVKRLSVELTGNNVLLPVAVAVAELAGSGAVSAPRVGEQLEGRVAGPRIGPALARLHRLGAIRELPYPGRPHPRMYESVDGPFWTFVSDWVLHPAVDTVS
jgi:hypothetical protein